jgi:hypothetical protein
MHLRTLDVAGHVAVGEPSAGVPGEYLSVDRKYRCEVIGDDSAAVLAMQIIILENRNRGELLQVLGMNRGPAASSRIKQLLYWLRHQNRRPSLTVQPPWSLAKQDFRRPRRSPSFQSLLSRFVWQEALIFAADRHGPSSRRVRQPFSDCCH